MSVSKYRALSIREVNARIRSDLAVPGGPSKSMCFPAKSVIVAMWSTSVRS